MYYNTCKGDDLQVTGQAEKGENMNDMNMSEAARLIIGLRAAGWNEKDINDFILYIETGDERYKPKEKTK